MIYLCGATIIRDCVIYQGCHSSEQDARDCSLLNLTLRDRSGMSAQEATIALHPELAKSSEEYLNSHKGVSSYGKY